jgi:transposase-like protein
LPDDLYVLLFYLSERKARQWLVYELNPDGATCPSCGQDQDSSRLELFYSLKRIKCSSCGRRFSALSGSALEGTQLEPRQIVTMLALFRMGRPNADIARAARMSRSTVLRWRRFFRAEGSKFV